jgi:hypothetical protein
VGTTLTFRVFEADFSMLAAARATAAPTPLCMDLHLEWRR